ncbi:PH domain-containing protein [Paenibacillus sp. GCM10027627]|uniref:PH domain-containing protein n=1 Tax=unclassified Paenibacillus TaxID=185978 RepID=UPI00363F6B72
MNERRMLHPAYILFGVLSVVRAFLPVIIIFLLKGVSWSEIEWYWFAGIGAGFLLLLLICYMHWKRFGFWLEEDRLVIRSGVFFRQEKTIYYSRIHSVNVEQPFIQRLLGVVQLKIETPGGGKQKAEGVMETLSMAEANRIKEQLRLFSKLGANKATVLEEGYTTPNSLPDESEATAQALSGDGNGNDSSSDNSGNVAANSSSAYVLEEQEPETIVSIDAGKLFKAAATSLNFGLAAAFIAGLYSFADDFINLLLPDHFFENVVQDSTELMPDTLLIVIAAVMFIALVWILSIVLYILKYSGFTIRRDGQQLSLSYGLLEKKSILFDPKKVQSVIVNESWLRQPFGYAEVKLQIVSSDKLEQLMLHPFIRVSEIQSLLDELKLGISLNNEEEWAKSPKKALLYYIRTPLIVALSGCAALIYFFGASGAWSLLIIPFIMWWRIGSHHSAGLLLQESQLTLRRRNIHRMTYYVRKSRIVVMKVKRTDAQRKKGVMTIYVHVLGSTYSYKVLGLNASDVEPAWNWFSKRRKC